MRRVVVLAAFSLVLIHSLVARAQVYVSGQMGDIGLWDLSGAPIDANLVTTSNFGGIALSGGDLYASRNSTINRYNASTGAPVSVPFISGLSNAWDLAISGNTLYSAFLGNNTVAKYDKNTGAPLAVPFINVTQPYGVVESGGRLYVAAESQSTTTGRIAVYNSVTGALINPNLATGLYRPHGLALWNGNIYVSQQDGTIGVYNALTGAVVSASLISGPIATLEDIAVHNGLLYVTNNGQDKVSVYDAVTGATINANFIVGIESPRGIVVVPEPGAFAVVGLALLPVLSRRRK